MWWKDGLPFSKAFHEYAGLRCHYIPSFKYRYDIWKAAQQILPTRRANLWAMERLKLQGASLWGFDEPVCGCSAQHSHAGLLTHWGRDKVAAILQTTFANAFSWLKCTNFAIKFDWSLFLKDRIDNIPALVQIMAWRHQATSHYLNQRWPSQLTHICVTLLQWVNFA